MSDEDKALELFNLVARQTLEKAIDWTPSNEIEDVFEFTTESGFTLKAYSFTSVETGDETGPPSLTVYGMDNKVIFDITSELKGVSEQALRAFYDNVRRSALDIDGKLQAVIDDLAISKAKAS